MSKTTEEAIYIIERERHAHRGECIIYAWTCTNDYISGDTHIADIDWWRVIKLIYYLIENCWVILIKYIFI